MNEERISYLMAYAKLLGEINSTDTFLYKEINEVVQELRKELHLIK
jgi:hypothetical protein